MSFKTWIHGFSEALGWVKTPSTDEGSISIIQHGGTLSGYKHYETTVGTGASDTYKCLNLIGRKCNVGYVVNDSDTVDISVYIDSTDNDPIVIKPSEILNLEGCNAENLIIAGTGTAIPYRISIK